MNEWMSNKGNLSKIQENKQKCNNPCTLGFINGKQDPNDLLYLVVSLESPAPVMIKLMMIPKIESVLADAGAH